MILKNYKLHNEAIKNIQNIYKKYKKSLFIGHSGGKDSQVILHLVQKAGIKNVTIIHNVKQIYDPLIDNNCSSTIHQETLKFLYSKIADVYPILFMSGSKTEQWVKENNYRCQIDGSRIDEANRINKSSDFIKDNKNINRNEMQIFEENGIFGLDMFYPIYKWTDNDIFEYLLLNNIPISIEYLENGEFYNFLKERK